MPSSLRPAWQLRVLRWSAYATVVMLLLALISWLSLPSFARRMAVEQTQETIGRKLSIGDVNFNPFTLTLKARDITLYEPDQSTPAFSAKELAVNASSTSLFRMAAILDAIKLTDPVLHLVRLNNDDIARYNFTDVIDRIQALPNSGASRGYSLANVQLKNGAILFDDNVTGKRIDIRTLNIGVPFISNLPRNIDAFVQPHLSATVNGTPLTLAAQSKPFTSSQDTVLAVNIDKLDLVRYLPFLPVALPVDLQSAKLSTALDVHFHRDQNKPQISLAGSIVLESLAMQEKNAAPLLQAASVSVKINKLDLLNMGGVIDQVTIDRPQIWVDLNRQGELNWRRIVKNGASAAEPHVASSATTAPAAAIPPLTVGDLTLRNGSIRWSDDAHASPRQSVQLDKIMIDAAGLSTITGAKPATLSLSATENGHGELGFTGDIAPLDADIRGAATLKSIQLSNYQHYVNGALNAALHGALSGQSNLQWRAGQFTLDQLNLEVSDFKLAAKRKTAPHTDLIAAKTITLASAALDLRTRKAEAETLQLTGLKGALRRDARGALNVIGLLAAPKTNVSSSSAQASAPAWQAQLRRFSIQDSVVSYEDASTSPTHKLRVDDLNLQVHNLSSEWKETATISLQARLNQNGKLAMTGQAAPQLRSIALALDAQMLPIAPFQSYFSDYLNVTVSTGTLSTKGKLVLTPPRDQQHFALRYTGAARLNNFRILDKLTAADFLRWKTLNLQGIDATAGDRPLFSVQKINLSDFYARAILSEQGKLNLQNIVVAKGQPRSAITAPAPAEKRPQTVAKTSTPSAPVTPAAADANAAVIRIGQTVLQGGNINFTDNFVQPNYSANMTGMSGSIGSIASDKSQPAAIGLHGKIDNDAPLQISGALNPLFKPMFLDIKASASGVQLPRLTPYSAKYAGYPITKGKLSMDVQYKIENDKLVAQNDVRIEQLTFGEHVDGPDVTRLPVMLAVSLLKDRDGVINLNLPVSGSLSDPQFSIGSVIMRVFVNLIVKAATSPFALISSMFGDNSGELSYIEFAPGSSALTPDIRKKLDTLGYALHERPALKIDVMGRADAAVDAAGLRQTMLNRKIDARMRQERGEHAGQPTDRIALSAADRIAYLEQVYKSADIQKPRNLIGLAKSLPPEHMQQLIMDSIPISQDDLRSLAQRRADLVRNYLQDQSMIAADRIYLIAPRLDASGIKDAGKSSRVDLSLQ